MVSVAGADDSRFCLEALARPRGAACRTRDVLRFFAFGAAFALRSRDGRDLPLLRDNFEDRVLLPLLDALTWREADARLDRARFSVGRRFFAGGFLTPDPALFLVVRRLFRSATSTSPLEVDNSRSSQESGEKRHTGPPWAAKNRPTCKDGQSKQLR